MAERVSVPFQPMEVITYAVSSNLFILASSCAVSYLRMDVSLPEFNLVSSHHDANTRREIYNFEYSVETPIRDTLTGL